ncbi:hypothetical protein OC846_001336 [Tilletia horrida]|uniref:Golgi apparatus membrane protein TVP38 n=1 Tax=Tilletia horrida TaxID=155126 RepID=A0AAN6JTN5_9BASI|nr:hypothetical protein OC845_001209 [Tilletia horrida]KAK0556240.1 hypothetical protein OC846_001336 [Tilletia horrida]KAK0569096.1 hypothetical protein OC861_001234 [Tilletia horrida]
MANPYYPPRPNHFGGPALRYDGSQQQEEYNNPYSRPQPDAYGYQQGPGPYAHNSNGYPDQQQQQPQHLQQSQMHAMAGNAYYDPYATTPSGYGNENFQLQAPQPGFAAGGNGKMGPGFIERPDSPFDGIYPDRAPKWEKMNSEQRKIAKSFPKDLDEEPKSMLQSGKELLRRWRDFVKWRYWYYYLLIIIIIALTVLMTIFHQQIITWLTPVSKKIKSVTWGWVIPVVIFVVISFPPLFGHEILAILCGVVYGLWIGFGITCLGTLLGEIANFYAFKTFLQKHAERYERKNISYGCMAHIVREGGFKVVLLARLSAIPGHFTTAVFATVGMSIWIFTLAAILSLPKQLAIVYLGVALEQSGGGKTESTSSKIVKYVVLLISLIITVWAAHYLYGKMEKARPLVQGRLRAKRFTLLSEARKTEVALQNTTDYERPASGSSGEHDENGTRPLQPDAQRHQAGQPIWNRWSASRPPQEEAEMQQMHYDRNAAASTSGLMPHGAPLARYDTRNSEMTMDANTSGNPVSLAGSRVNIDSANQSRDDFIGQTSSAYPQTSGPQNAPPQLRIDPHATAQQTAQPARTSPQGTSLVESLSPTDRRASRYLYQSAIGSIYSLQPSTDDSATSPHSHQAQPFGRQAHAAEADNASLPSYTTMPPQINEVRAQGGQPAQQQYPQSQYQHLQPQQQQQHQQPQSQPRWDPSPQAF